MDKVGLERRRVEKVELERSGVNKNGLGGSR